MPRIRLQIASAAALLAGAAALIGGLVAGGGWLAVPWALATGGLAGAAGWMWGGRQLDEPLGRLADTLRELGAGNLAARVDSRPGDPAHPLAEGIDRVAVVLEERLGELQREKDRLDGVLQAIGEGVLVVGDDGRIAVANPRLREWFGLTAPPEGRPPIEVIRNSTLDAALEEAPRSDEPIVREIHLAAPRRRVLRAHLAGFPAEDRQGVVAVFHDITEIRRLESVRRDFVAAASHELKTPLTAIRGFAETLLGGSVGPDDTKRQLEIILKHAQRLSRIVDDLLELSRAESGALRLQLESVDLPEIGAALLQSLESRHRARSLHVRLSDSGAVPARADRAAVEQLLENLLDNAIKYTDPGGSVEVRFSSDERHVLGEVVDTGIGIPEAHLSRIFERFYRVDRARSRALGGTGLGLSIVKNLVREMGGEVSVESTPGEGSTFRFTLPRA